MSVFVKICGLANAADVAAVAALRPDALGFVFWPRSPRAVTPEQVADWTRALPPGPLKVGVFVNDDPEAIRQAVDIARLDVVQWHGFPAAGSIPAGFFQKLEHSLSTRAAPSSSRAGGTARPGRRVSLWKVVRLHHTPPPADGRPAPEDAAAAPACVDALVLDSYSPAAPGGTGQAVDWTAARAFVAASRTKVLLAGGLNPDNLAAALAAVQPWGVDVSSGVEVRPGRKNLDAVQRFIQICRAH